MYNDNTCKYCSLSGVPWPCVQGVTFLAFGNGAPDIFSAIAAIGNAKNGEAGLAFGALFGLFCLFDSWPILIREHPAEWMQWKKNVEITDIIKLNKYNSSDLDNTFHS